jgi:hypothetical protein
VIPVIAYITAPRNMTFDSHIEMRHRAESMRAIRNLAGFN